MRTRHKNHLRFNHRYRDEDVTPSSLNIKNPIPTMNAETIFKKSKKSTNKRENKSNSEQSQKNNAQINEETDNFKQNVSRWSRRYK